MTGLAGQVGVAVAAGLVVAVALVAAPASPGVGLATAAHDPAGTDFTYEPMSPEDRRPGATDTRAGTIGQATADVETDFETLLELRSVFREGSWEGCGPTSSEVFGIDRGGDDDGYAVDESLENNVKRFSSGEDVFEAAFYDEDDFGPSTHLSSDDQVVSIIECVDNPEEPGWYQIDVAAVRGRTTDGEVVTHEDASHYFWICECADEAAARERLGPPPSEPAPTATPTADGSGDGIGSDGDPSGTATAGTPTGEGETSDDDATPDGTTTAAQDTATGTAATGSATATAATPAPAGEWADYRVRTPTPGDGAGVPPVAAIGALLAAVLLHRRG